MKQQALEQNKWVCEREWLHNKYYKYNSPNDGFKLQICTVKNLEIPEIPYKRKLFYKSRTRRFSLGDLGPVAYFSEDFATNCCETIKPFRSDENLHFPRIQGYLQGKTNPEPDKFYYPISVRISDKAVILDVSRRENPLFEAIVKIGPWATTQDFIDSIIMNRDDSVIKETQALAIAAHNNDFDGLIYKSVRAPLDVVLPEHNLVMFKKSLIIDHRF